MEKTRTRAWRRNQAKRVFKARLKYAAVCMSYPKTTWEELQKTKWAQHLRTTGTPCSCWLCRRESFDRNSAKREWVHQVNEALMDNTAQ